jgi:hydroxypyruvate isomerase
MQRRSFLTRTLAASAALAAPRVLDSQSFTDIAPAEGTAKHKFKLLYAPHDGMFANNGGKNFLDQIRFMHDQGFMAIEDNGMTGRDPGEQEKIGQLLADLGMTMGVFVVNGSSAWKPSLTTGTRESVDDFVRLCNESVEVAKRCNAKWMTVVPGFYQRNLPEDIQTANVIECLRRGAEVLEPHGLVMVLEPLSDTPELFLRQAAQTYLVCKAVNSPSCKILYDVYHMQRNRGHLIPSIEQCWDEIAYFQIGDNPGRNEPTTGEVNYKNIFKYIHERGFKGVLGMEHGNSRPGKEGEMRVIEAYKESDNF